MTKGLLVFGSKAGCTSYGFTGGSTNSSNNKTNNLVLQELEQRVKYLQRVINEPLDSSSEIVILGLANKEWALFSYSFSSYAMTSLALRDTAYKQRAAQIIKSAIDKVLDEIISGHFYLLIMGI